MESKVEQWYYVLNNQCHGPVDVGTMEQLMQGHFINANTLIWQTGMASWAPLQSTPLQAIIKAPAQMPPVPYAQPSPYPQPAYYQVPAQMATPESTKNLFMWYWILLVASVPLFFIYIGMFTLVAALVIQYILLYRYWSAIQDGNVRTTAGKAVGFLFIPFYSFYWVFPAHQGLAEDTNRYCRERNIPAPMVSDQLGLWIAICSMPLLNYITGIVTFILYPIFFNGLNKTYEAIFRYKYQR